MKELPEIPYRWLLGHLLWILGAALILAVFSFKIWQTQAGGQKLKGLLKERWLRQTVVAAGCLAALGISMIVSSPLAAVLAFAVGFALGLLFWKLMRSPKKK
ncbi:MAG: hypothetical protein FJY83_10270 [Candidatus Aminicenantes bacterium]|nr:hypothetical protein [Candidatus Aminicenantes bacterium]